MRWWFSLLVVCAEVLLVAIGISALVHFGFETNPIRAWSDLFVTVMVAIITICDIILFLRRGTVMGTW